jgi:hypothetical protein
MQKFRNFRAGCHAAQKRSAEQARGQSIRLSRWAASRSFQSLALNIRLVSPRPYPSASR